MIYHTNAVLMFLAACLAITVGTLFSVMILADADPALVAAFTLSSLGIVVAALVIMYWRNPALLTPSVVASVQSELTEDYQFRRKTFR